MFDPNSDTWRQTAVRVQAEIYEAQGRLEQTGLTQAETEFERGRIAAARAILRMADPAPKVPAAPKY